MRKITVANQKGGVGKTDLCVNLAACLADLGAKVLLIDLDPQANTTSYITNKKFERTSKDLLLDASELKDIVVKTDYKNLDLVPSSRILALAEVRLANDVSMQFKLKKKLKGAVNKYDFVFIDTPPSLGTLTVNALTASDSVISPIQIGYFALDGVAQLLGTVDAIKKDINHKLAVDGFVLTMYDKRNKLSKDIEKMVRKAFKGKVFKTVIPVSVDLTKAPNKHKPIIHCNPKSKASKAYRKLAAEILAFK